MTQHPFPRINLATITPDNAPQRGTISHFERNDPFVRDAGQGRVLLGTRKVRFEILRADANVIYLFCRDERRRPTATLS